MLSLGQDLKGICLLATLSNATSNEDFGAQPSVLILPALLTPPNKQTNKQTNKQIKTKQNKEKKKRKEKKSSPQTGVEPANVNDPQCSKLGWAPAPVAELSASDRDRTCKPIWIPRFLDVGVHQAPEANAVCCAHRESNPDCRFHKPEY
jgi:hypothetical protein